MELSLHCTDGDDIVVVMRLLRTELKRKVEELVEKSLAGQSSRSRIPAHDAAINGNATLVQLLLSACPLVLDLHSADGVTMFTAAARADDEDGVSTLRVLLKALERFGCNDPITIITSAITVAAGCGNAPSVRMLLDFLARKYGNVADILTSAQDELTSPCSVCKTTCSD